jgi:hypothetical protein
LSDADLIPVEAPEAQPLDELTKALLSPLKDEDVVDLYQAITTDYTQAINDRSEWETRLAEWDALYFGILPEKTVPWPGASNLHVPLTMLGVETLKPRLTESILGGPILAIPTEATDIERRDRVEQFMNWQSAVELDLRRVVPETAHLFLTPGTCVVKVYWRSRRTKRKYIRTFPPTTPIDEIMLAIFGQAVPKTLESEGKTTWTGELPSTPGGPPLTFRVELKITDTEINALVEQETLAEKPVIEPIDPLDFIAPVHGGSSVQDLPWCQLKLRMTEDELRRHAKSGRFDADVVEELLRTSEAGVEDELVGSAYRTQQDELEGVQAGESSVRTQQYEILEDYRRWDLDGDGLEEEIITWVSRDLSDKLLGRDYLDNVYAHGMRPIEIGRYFPIPFRLYGLSFPEVVRNLNEEINTIHNQRVDAGTLQNLPWYLYRASALHAPTRYPLRPGEGIPIDNPQTDVVIPRWQGTSVFGQNEESLVYQYFERLTGLTDLSLGRQPSRVGATRTATGVASLLSESGLRFKTAMDAFQAFWVRIFQQVLALNQQYLPPGKEFRVTGKLPEFITLKSRAEIAGQYDIRLSATTETMNKQVQREDATLIMQTVLNPLGLQLGIVAQKGIVRAYRELLSAFGKDPDLYIEPQVEEQIALTPTEKLMMIASGVEVRPHLGENLQAALLEHMIQRRTPAVLNGLGPQGIRKLDQLIAQTQQLVQTQQVVQQLGGGKPGQAPVAPQGPPVGQQAQNAQIGRQPQGLGQPAELGLGPTQTTLPPVAQ